MCKRQRLTCTHHSGALRSNTAVSDTNACLQVTSASAAADTPLPAMLSLPGDAGPLVVTSLAAITGRRFLSPLSITAAQAQPSKATLPQLESSHSLKRAKPDGDAAAETALSASERTSWHHFALDHCL